MEHRNGSRIKASLDAEIYCRGKKLGKFPVQNIGAGGLCLEDRDEALESDVFLQVFIKACEPSPQTIYMTSAIVVWAGAGQAGLMWADDNLKSSALFRDWQKSTRSSSRPAGKSSAAALAACGFADVDAEPPQEDPCKWCCTRKRCLVTRLEDEKVIALANLMRQHRVLHKGEQLYLQGDPFDALHIIQSGSFKSSISDGSGTSRITGFYYPGEILGLDGMESGRHRFEVEALETASVCILPFGVLGTLTRGNQGSFYRHLTGLLVGMAFRESNLLLVLGRMCAEQRLARFLLDTAERTGFGGRRQTEVKLAMTRHDIANYLGLAVETLSRLFRRFREGDLIVTERQNIRLCDIQGLRRIADGDSTLVAAQRR